ncbi:unnamed protein product [Moneuplotes crassus]|uniref:Uncharacterized protein n=1 Tax=Euplotes crassus TaxID=5936 RepID=A0AAD2D6A1_EUPCR|nr:unnamed protein product [Moneuplotes crassus]
MGLDTLGLLAFRKANNGFLNLDDKVSHFFCMLLECLLICLDPNSLTTLANFTRMKLLIPIPMCICFLKDFLALGVVASTFAVFK